MEFVRFISGIECSHVQESRSCEGWLYAVRESDRDVIPSGINRQMSASEPAITGFDMRASMSDRNRFDTRYWLRTTLTLLAMIALVLVAPMRMLGSVAGTSRSICLQSQFVPDTEEPSILSSDLSAPDAVLQVTALAAEKEKSSSESALDESRVFFLTPWCFRKASDRCLFASPPDLSHYHLRC
jgi:hypothetical protein